MKFQQLMESYGMLKQETRMFYPRNFNLSDKFLKALREELLIQEKAGIDPTIFARKLNRALQFHIDEHNKAHRAVAEKARVDEYNKELEKRAIAEQIALKATQKKAS